MRELISHNWHAPHPKMTVFDGEFSGSMDFEQGCLVVNRPTQEGAVLFIRIA